MLVVVGWWLVGDGRCSSVMVGVRRCWYWSVFVGVGWWLVGDGRCPSVLVGVGWWVGWEN